MMRPRIDLIVASVVAALAVARDSRADWPMPRHDAQRTGALLEGALDVAVPAVSWRYYLGGELSETEYLVIDVDEDGRDEVVYLAGGKLLAKLPDDTIVWESEPLGLTDLVTVADLDGRAGLEIVCGASPSSVYVLSGGSGRVLSSLRVESDEGRRGTYGNLLVGDLDADGFLDLLVGEHGCATLSSGIVFDVYSFTEGAETPTRRARVLKTDPGWSDGRWCGGAAHALLDADGDGELEVALVSWDRVFLYDLQEGSTIVSDRLAGDLVPEGSDSTFCAGTARSAVADLDLDGDEELVLLVDRYRSFEGDGGHGFRTLDLDIGARRLEIVGRYNSPDREQDRLRWGMQPLVDLDAGREGPELVVATTHAGVTTLQVFDPLTGEERVTFEGSIPVGAADLDGDGLDELLARQGSTLRLLELEGGELVERASHEGWGGGVVETVESWVPRPYVPRTRPATIDLDGDGRAELLVATGGALLAASLAAPDWSVLGRHDLEEGVSVLCAGAHPESDFGGPLLLAGTDGYLLVLDEGLRPANAGCAGEFCSRGMRIGGYYTGGSRLGQTLLAVDVDGDLAEETLAVRDSRGRILSLDASDASMVAPPVTSWAVACGQGLFGRVLEDGSFGMLCQSGSRLRRVDPRSGEAYVFAEDPEPTWMETGQSLWSDGLLGDANGDSVDDLFVTINTGAQGMRAGFGVVDGRTLTPLWEERAPDRSIQSGGPMPMALTDLDEDGRDDFVGVINSFLAVLTGPEGPEILENEAPEHLQYFTPVVFDWDGDGEDELFLGSGHRSMRLYERSPSGVDDPFFEAMQWPDTAPTTHVHGGVAVCPGGPRLVGGAYDSPVLRAAWPEGDLASEDTVVLAEGRLYREEAELPAGARRGALGNVTVVGSQPRPGEGAEPTALVGSTDGFLYAISACTLELLWAVDFRFPVGEPIPVDGDGDGRQETIVVSVADGFLYGVRQQVLPAPRGVREVDPPRSGDADVDEVDSSSELVIRWDPVEGATGYEYALLSPSGELMTDPPFAVVDAGSTEARLTDVRLVLGARYTVAVRALSEEGSSAEALSDGVTIRDLDAPLIDLSAWPTTVDAEEGGAVRLDVSMADRWGLAAARWQLVGPDGRAPLELGDLTVDGGSATASASWQVAPGSAAGAYLLRATATDLQGHEAEAVQEIVITVDQQDGGGDRPGDDESSTGCSCRVATGRSPSSSGLVQALVGLLRP